MARVADLLQADLSGYSSLTSFLYISGALQGLKKADLHGLLWLKLVLIMQCCEKGEGEGQAGTPGKFLEKKLSTLAMFELFLVG